MAIAQLVAAYIIQTCQSVYRIEKEKSAMLITHGFELCADRDISPQPSTEIYLGEIFTSLLDRSGVVWFFGFCTSFQNIYQDNSSIQPDLLHSSSLHFAENSTWENVHTLLRAERLHFVLMKRLGCSTGLLLSRSILNPSLPTTM